MVILRLHSQNRMVTKGYRKGVYDWVGQNYVGTDALAVRSSRARQWLSVARRRRPRDSGSRSIPLGTRHDQRNVVVLLLRTELPNLINYR
jgi:hypothetical protein